MVASKQMYVIRVIDLQYQHEGNDFYAKLAAIDVVSEEEEVFIGRCAESIEDVEQVEELSMDVSDDDQRRTQPQQVGLAL